MRVINLAMSVVLGAWISSLHAATPVTDPGALSALKSSWELTRRTAVVPAATPSPAAPDFSPFARRALDFAREAKGTPAGAEALRWTLEGLIASPAPDASLLHETLDRLATDHLSGPTLLRCLNLLQGMPTELTGTFLETVIARSPSPQARILAWTLKAS